MRFSSFDRLHNHKTIIAWVALLFAMSANLGAQSFAAKGAPFGVELSNNSVYKNRTYSIALTGTGTSWTSGTTFTITGGTGASKTLPGPCPEAVNPGVSIAQGIWDVPSQQGCLTFFSGTANGTITVHDSTDALTLTINVVTTATIQTPTATVDNNNPNVALLQWTVYPDSQCWVQYGVAHNTYLWSSTSHQSGSPFTPGLCSLPITGLADGTQYFFLPTAREHNDDETNGCMTVAQSCGAVELTATTPAATVSHLPAAPSTVQANLLCEPDDPSCSSYSIPYVTVDLSPTGANNECVATATVNAPSGYTGTINSGDTLTTIFAAPGTKLWFGTVFRYPQGQDCIVPNVSNGHGYNYPPMPVDPLAIDITDPKHRWIIFRTKQNSAADFPPFDKTTGPNFFGKLGGFQQLGATTANLGSGGSIFNATAAGQVHHLWMENGRFSVDPTALVNHDFFFVFGRGSGGQAPPYPRYIVFRSNYFHAPTRSSLTVGNYFPYVKGLIYATMQQNMQWAVVGNYADNLNYGGDGYPVAFEWSDCGFTGTCGYGGPAEIKGNVVIGMDESIYVEVNNHSANPSPNDFTVIRNYLYTNPAEVAFGQAIGFTACGRAKIEYKGMLRSLTKGNYISGQPACTNSGPGMILLNTVDSAATSNIITRAAAQFSLVGSNTGTSTQAFGATSNRVRISNNYTYDLGRTLYGGGGGGNSPVLGIDSPISNLSVTNNTFGTISDVGGFYTTQVLAQGGGGGAAGFRFRNNVYSFGIGGAGAPTGGGIIAQNTIGLASHMATPASVNSTNYLTSLNSLMGVADGAAGLGMTFASITSGGSGYTQGATMGSTGCTSSPSSTIDVTSGAVISIETFAAFGSGCNPATWTATAPTGTGAVLRPHYGLTPAYDWGGNIAICATYDGTDMTSAQCQQTGGSSLTSTMPPGDAYPLASTAAGRKAAAGYVGLDAGNGGCSPTLTGGCGSGVNMNALEADLGIVSNITAQVSANACSINYVAPDTSTCSVDISSDGVSWTRQADSGGNRNRSVPFTVLSSTQAYSYRVMCSIDQTDAITNNGFLFPYDTSNLKPTARL